MTSKNKELKVRNESYARQLNKLELKLETEQERTVEIEKQKDYMQTKKYVEEVAREKLGLYYPDEIIFKEEE